MLLKKVENTVGKGEIARYEQFLLFPQCIQKDLNCRLVNDKFKYYAEDNFNVAQMVHFFYNRVENIVG